MITITLKISLFKVNIIHGAYNGGDALGSPLLTFDLDWFVYLHINRKG